MINQKQNQNHVCECDMITITELPKLLKVCLLLKSDHCKHGCHQIKADHSAFKENINLTVNDCDAPTCTETSNWLRIPVGIKELNASLNNVFP